MTLMKKITSAVLLCLLLLSICIPQAAASGPIDVNAYASLTVEYKYENEAIPNATFRVYRIADIDSNCNFTVNKKFAGYPVTLKDNTIDSWNEVALTLKGFVLRDQLKADRTLVTNAKGTAKLDEINPGLYLVFGEKVVIGKATYTTSPSIVSVPSHNLDNDAWDYHPIIHPKGNKVVPPEKTVELRVVKIWDDNGRKDLRPSKITVELLADGVAVDRVNLTAAGNWRHTWTKLPAENKDGSAIEYTVVESEAKGYTSTVKRDGATFYITNYSNTPPPSPPPEVPDTGMLWWPVPILACMGVALITFGIYRRRRSQR